jgi:hypothetical protein
MDGNFQHHRHLAASQELHVDVTYVESLWCTCHKIWTWSLFEIHNTVRPSSCNLPSRIRIQKIPHLLSPEHP